MANYIAIDLQQVKDVKDIINRDILETACGINEKVFSLLGINFRTGIENKDSIYVFNGNENIAAPKTPGDVLASTLGDMLERVLEVKPVWSRVPDNLDNYREKEPISILGLSENGVTAEHTRFQLLQAARLTSGQVRKNLFLGVRDTTATGAARELALFDGFYKKIADMKAGTGDLDKDKNGNPLISAANGNLIATSPILAAATAEAAYDEIVEFYQALDPIFASGEEDIIFYVCPAMRLKIIQGYLEKYTGLQALEVNQPSYRFVDMPNVEFRAHAALGYGDQIIATVPGNLDYGTDMTTNGDPSNANVNIMQDQNDAHTIIIQIDLAAGTRIREVHSSKFATNDKINYANKAAYDVANP